MVNSALDLKHLSKQWAFNRHFFFTIDFLQTKFIVGVIRISVRILPVKYFVVDDDVSPVVRTADVDRIRYRGSGVVGVPKTQQ